MSHECGEHDYVVVGAGSAGSVVVRRLLDRGRSVHLLEAGPEIRSEYVDRPDGWPRLIGGPWDWALSTTRQRHAAGRPLTLPRGRLVGGCGAVDGMIYMRGHRSGYDEWARAGASGWDWDTVLPYFLRSEDHQDGAGPWHGAGGPLPVSRIAVPHETAAAFVEGAVALGFPRTDDFNGPEPIGAGFNHLTVRDGLRVSPWRAFAGPVRGHPLLTVTPDAYAHRVLFEGDRAAGVEYEVAGRLRRTRARAEVVLCGGVVGSPKLLLLSGVGPADALRRLGIPVVHDLPGVGENLHDHLLVPIVHESYQPLAPGSANLLESQLWWRTDSRRPGPDVRPLFMQLVHPADGYPAPEHGFTIAPGLMAPLSRGTLRLASADPRAAALLDPNVLAESADLETLVDAVEICREIGAGAALAPWRRTEVAPGPGVRTREDLRHYVRTTVTTYHHQVGTCRMGQDPLCVVGPRLDVNGLRGLRVADASVMPSVPSASTNAPTVMIGERAAGFILGDV